MIVDANVHATRAGSWFGTGHDASLERLLGALDAAEVDRAMLTGIPGHVDTDEVVELAARSDGRLVPVGTFDPGTHASPEAAAEAVRALRERDLAGFKLHPRMGGYDLLDDRVLAAVDEVASWPRPPAIWICTFLHQPGLRPLRGPVESLCEIVGRAPGVTFVLAHGGGPDLLRLATAVRSAHNALLDLSYTVTHLIGSSVALDLEHLLRTFDRRLVFGSDFPEGDIGEARRNLERLVERANPAAHERVFGANLEEALAR